MIVSGRLNFKLTHILPAVAGVLCLLFQHNSVGAEAVNNEYSSNVLITNEEGPTPVLPFSSSPDLQAPDSVSKKDSLTLKTDTIKLTADTTIDTESLKSKV